MNEREAIMWRTVAIALLRRIGGRAVIESQEMTPCTFAYRLIPATEEIEIELHAVKQ